MYRRTLLRWLAAGTTVLRSSFLRADAPKSVFSPEEHLVLQNLAGLVLPSSLGDAKSKKIAVKFETYVRDYRPGADTEHGYGFTRVVPKPPAPAQRYVEQLRALPSPLTKTAVQQALAQAGVKELPRTPDGKSVIADLMAFYFRSSDANDVCYGAAIGRDQCRGLPGSEHPPAALREQI